MTLTLSMPMSFSEQSSEPVFKSVRSPRPVPVVHVVAQDQPTFETAEPDTWYDEKSNVEVLTDLFWGRRTISGDIRSRGKYRSVLHWQALASLLLFPPIGFLINLANICFGLRPKVTRVGFIASLAMAALVASNMWLADTPMLMAALR